MTNTNHTDTPRSGDLKPCPFCGGEAVDFYRANTGATADWCGPVDHWVCCTGECGASTCMHGTKDEAIAAWNTRTADRIEELASMEECLTAELGDANDRIEALEAEVERLRDDSWFDQFEEQEQLRDNAEQRLSVVEAENERLRGVLEAVWKEATTMRNASKLIGPYPKEPANNRVWARSMYHAGKKLHELIKPVRAALGEKQ